MLLRVLGVNVEDCPVREIVVSVHRVCTILYPAEIIRDRVMRTWPMLDVEVKFLQKQHPSGQFPC